MIILILNGFAFRAWQISSAGLDHFDEGVYVFSALGLTDSHQPYRLYPGQFKFSPPLFFSLVGLGYQVFGAPLDRAAILINVLLGTLTIGLIWWVGRTWFGPPAGLAAAALLALSGYHIAFARTSLTDVSFAFFFLLALALIALAIERQSFGWAVVAGLAVGLAWNTKYHGWFALAVAGGALLPLTGFRYFRGQFTARVFLLWGVIAAVAVACYLPWATYVQMQPGGYAGLTQYQRTLIHPHNWFQNFWQQAQQQLLFEGPLSRASILAALVAAIAVNPGVRFGPKFLFGLIFVAVSSILIGGSGTAALLALLALPALLRRSASFSTWLVLGWLGLWFLATPLYHPYARLVLPFTVATYLVAGWWLARLVTEPASETQSGNWRLVLAAGSAAVVVAVAALAIPNPGNPWRSSRGMAEAAAAMESIIPAGSRVIVIGEPALAFYLHLANRPAFERIENIDALADIDAPIFVVTGVYAKRAPPLREGLQKLGNRLTPIETFPVVPSDVRLLDDFRPQDAGRFRAAPDETFAVTLYSLQAKQSNALNNPRPGPLAGDAAFP